MKPLDVFLSRLNPLVPGCPEPVAFQALRDTAIAFCEDTHVVQVFTDPVRTSAGQQQYDIDTPSQTELLRVLAAWHNGTPLDPVAQQNVRWAQAPGTDPEHAPATGTPRVAYIIEPRTAHLYPVPGEREVGQLTFKVATKPTRSATQVEDVLYDDWAEAIVYGAAARLCAMPGRSYSNVDQAAASAMMYRASVGPARLEARKGRVMADVVVTPRPFIRGSGF